MKQSTFFNLRTIKIASLVTVSFAASTSVSNAQVKKTLFEDFTGAWCGHCPDGTNILEGMKDANPGSIIPVYVHLNDGLSTSEGNMLANAFNIGSFPSGMISRHYFSGGSITGYALSRWAWELLYEDRATIPAIASISISNAVRENDTTYRASINVSFTSLPTAGVPLKVNLLLTEDSIPAVGSLAQTNFSGSIQGGASPLANWYHNATLRKITGDDIWGYGDVFPTSPSTGITYSKNVTFTVSPGWNPSQMNAIAYVAYDGTVAAHEKEIINTEQMRLSDFANTTSLNEIAANQAGFWAYPNPASTGSMLKISFALEKATTVSLEVYNINGQSVSHPYSSYEIAGSHTIQWDTKNRGAALPPGTYFIKLSTGNSSKTVPVVLQ